jgi:tetratricopeptide (TPR) repeat protein
MASGTETVMISAIGGAPGVGKTALAVRWAHQVASRFPDGQLYVNLRGYDLALAPMSAAEAVRLFLDAFQIAAERIPASPEAQAGLYRSVLAGKKVLIVADNAADAAQVRPLLPGSPGCMVLVTSRSTLAGLVATDGASPLSVDVLTSAEARDLLCHVLGKGRVDAEPDAAGQLIEACGQLPLALAITAARAATRPRLPLAAVAAELADTAGRLDALQTAGDPLASVRGALECSYDHLRADAAGMFRLLGIHPGPDISTPAAASLAGLPGAQAALLLADLSDVSLVARDGADRYALHDLVRLYAAEQAERADCRAERQAATCRMLDHYTRTATAAAMAISPQRNLEVPGQPVPGARPEVIASQDEAYAWLRSEHAVLMRAVGHAAAVGADDFAWRLPLALTDFHDRAGYWHDWASCQQIALAAAERLGDIAAQSNAHRYLGRASFLIQRHDDALDHLTRSVRLRHQIGPPAAEAGIYIDLCRLHEQRGNPDKALQSAEQALGLYQTAQHRIGQAHALNAVGFYQALLFRYPEALRHCEQAVSLATEIGDSRAQAQALESLGFIHQRTGRPSQAVTCYQQSLALHRELADRYHIAKLLRLRGDAHQAIGNLGAARTAWREALTILDDLRHSDAQQVRARLHAAEQGPPTAKPTTEPTAEPP